MHTALYLSRNVPVRLYATDNCVYDMDILWHDFPTAKSSIILPQALPVCSKVTYSHPHLEGMDVLESRQLRFQDATNFSSKAAGIDWKWAPCGRPCAWANVQIDENGMKKCCEHTCFGQKICLIYISVPGRAILRVCWNGGRPPLLQDLHGSFSCHFCPRTCPPRWLKYLTKEKSFLKNTLRSESTAEQHFMLIATALKIGCVNPSTARYLWFMSVSCASCQKCCCQPTRLTADIQNLEGKKKTLIIPMVGFQMLTQGVGDIDLDAKRSNQ